MTVASTTGNMSPRLREVAERAKREPEGRFHSLAHLIDVSALERAHQRMRKDAAVGVDGVTKDQYGQELAKNVADLHERLKTKRYRHQPIRRAHIPKPNGKTRPIGISTVEDKLVQDAVREVLEAIYEQDFLDCSYGFRPGRSAHDAIRAVGRSVMSGRAKWIIEADIVGFFDNVDRKALLEMIELRVADGSLLRLIGKCLHVGVLDREELSRPEEGTAQGSVLSPLLGNIYLHHVLDLWFEREVKPRLVGEASVVRYADDFVLTFERRDDAERVWRVIGKRLQRYGLTLHPDKSRLFSFDRPSRGRGGKGPTTFDFLGFTHHWRRSRRGTWGWVCKTRREGLRRALEAVADWCRRHRHWSWKDQHAALSRRVRGHVNYFGVNGNGERLEGFIQRLRRIWHSWLQRRSQRSRMRWDRFNALLQAWPLPAPLIKVQIWEPRP